METLSVIQLKVSSLEHAVDRITHDLAHGGKYSDPRDMRYVEKYQDVASAMSNTSTPRTSAETLDRNPSSRPSRNKDVWEEKAARVNYSSNSIRQPLSMVNRNFKNDRPGDSTGQDLPNMTYHRSKHNDTTSKGFARQKVRVNGKDIWNHVKDLLCEGDLDSAYREALHSGNQLLLIELIDGTGPVLDSLSNETISNLFTALASCVVEHRIVDSVIPWLQQVTPYFLFMW